MVDFKMKKKNLLAKPISPLCYLSIKIKSFPNTYKIVKLKYLFKKLLKTDLQNHYPIPLFPLLLKIIGKSSMTKPREFLNKHCVPCKFQFNFAKIISQTNVLLILQIKLLLNLGRVSSLVRY